MTKNSGNEGGYKKPPKKNQFKPGKSGNPKGRPKGSRNLDKVFEEAFNIKLLSKENGQGKKISVTQALAQKLLAKALGGDLKAMELLFKYKERLDLKEEEKRKLEEKANGKTMLEQFAEFEELIKGAKLGDPKGPPEDLQNNNQEKSA